MLFDDFDTEVQAEETQGYQDYQDYLDVLDMENEDPDFEAEIDTLTDAVAELAELWEIEYDDETDAYAGDR